ncbi:MAG: hypothetical protein U0935_05085 [Pirellulales bacterium]
MSTEENAVNERAHRRSSHALIAIWSIGVGGLVLFTGMQIGTSMYRSRLAADQRHEERMNPKLLESGLEAEDAQLPPGATPIEVTTGVYIDRIVELSVKETGWTVDFYVWFRWKGEGIQPGDDFQVIDGWIEEKNKESEFVNGDEHYERYRVIARISKFFDVTRFPVEEHLLTLNIELASKYRHEAILVPDTENCGISSRVKIPAFRIVRKASVEKPHLYKTTLGDPRIGAEVRSIRSQFRYGIWVQRDGWGFFFKMFQGLFASLAVALAAFFIKPTDVDPRFGLGVGAFFASMANSYVTSSLIPDTGVMTLADIINGLAMASIFLTIVQSVVSLYLYDILEQEEISRKFDKWSVWTFVIGIGLINVLIPLAAHG